MVENETIPRGDSRGYFMPDNGYEDDKREKKQKIMRNEFTPTGKYGIPLVRKQPVDAKKIVPWSYAKTKPDDTENRFKTIHFYTYDWLFETVYQKPEAALEKLDQYHALFTPDFSLYFGMPAALQIHNTFKNRWCGAFWQMHGMNVIPSIEWSDETSFGFCFDGVERGSAVAVSTYAREQYENEFMKGYDTMLDVVDPSIVFCYGEPFPKMRGNVAALDPFNEKELIAKLGIAEFLKKKLEKTLYPSN